MFKEISEVQYKTILLWIEKYSNGQHDVYAAIQDNFKNWLSIEINDDFVEDVLKAQNSLKAVKRFFAENQIVVIADNGEKYGFAISDNDTYYYDELKVILRGKNFYSKEITSMEEKDVSTVDITDTNVMPAPIAEKTIDITEETAITSPEEKAVATADTSLDMLTVEIKFHLNQMGFHIIEVGKRLIIAKEKVPHGKWQNWLKENFNLTSRTAQNFMEISRRFSKTKTFSFFDISTFKPSQLLAMLALPEGDEEKFIEQKAAEGTPVDEMSVRELKAQIKQFKAERDKAIADAKNWETTANNAETKADNFYDAWEKLQEVYKRDSESAGELLLNYNELNLTKEQLEAENAELRNKLMNTPTKEVPPPDYDDLKREVKELRKRPVEVATELPADYKATKQELAKLKGREGLFKRNYDAVRKLELLYNTMSTLLSSDAVEYAVNYFSESSPATLQALIANTQVLLDYLTKGVVEKKETKPADVSIDRNAIETELKEISALSKDKATALKRLLLTNFNVQKIKEVPDAKLPSLLSLARKL